MSLNWIDFVDKIENGIFEYVKVPIIQPKCRKPLKATNGSTTHQKNPAPLGEPQYLFEFVLVCSTFLKDE